MSSLQAFRLRMGDRGFRERVHTGGFCQQNLLIAVFIGKSGTARIDLFLLAPRTLKRSLPFQLKLPTHLYSTFKSYSCCSHMTHFLK